MKSVRHLIFTILLVVMVSATCTSAYAVRGEDAEFAPAPYYGREALSELENSDALLYAYDQIVAGVETCTEKIDVVKDGYVLSDAEFSTVFDAYIRDHTEHFWLGTSYSLWANDETVVAMSPSYTMSGSELDAAKEAFEQAAENMLSGITETMSEFDRELVLHNRLAVTVSYAESTHAHNAYGALVEGTAVCEGYAEAFQYLLQRVGIQSFLIQGYGLSPSGQVEAHEWNAVRIDGNYYHVDLTWNDQGKYLFHSYFNLSTEAMEADHRIYDAAYDLPECDSDDANYFEVKGGKLETYDVENVAAILKENDFVASIYLPSIEEVRPFVSWAIEHRRDIASKAGVKESFSFGYVVVGQEVILKVQLQSFKHNFSAWYMISAPTCAEDGEEIRECINCNYSETRDIEPYGHDYVPVVTPPTCTEKGYTTFTCSVCGDSCKDNYVDGTGHSYGDWTVTDTPGCTEPGEKRRDCNDCDAFETEEIPATGHNYIPVVTPPTCTEQGYTTHTCENCGDAYADTYVEVLGHDFQSYSSDGNATCDEDGTKTAKCERCEVTDTVADPGSATGHSFGDWTGTDTPGCTEPGEKRRDCNGCDAFETEKIPATGHNYIPVVTPPTCTEQGYTTHACENCEDAYADTYVEVLGHDFQSYSSDGNATCDEDGTKTAKCERCEVTDTVADPGSATGHSFGDWTGTDTPGCTEPGEKRRDCNDCDAFETEKIPATGHNYIPVVTPPTCTEQGYTTHACENCGDAYADTYADATGHTLKNAIENSQAYHICGCCDYRQEVSALQAEENHVSIVLDDCPDLAQIYVVVFTSDGQMKGLQLVTVTANQAEFGLNNADQTNSIKAFFLGGQFNPWLRGMDISLS